MPSPNTWGSLREGGEGHLSLDVLFVGVELNSSRLLLKEGVRLVVGFCGEGDGWFWGGVTGRDMDWV